MRSKQSMPHQYTEALIQKILKSDAEFKRLILDYLALCWIAEQFPQHAEALFQKTNILNDNAEFERFITNQSALIRIATQFPQHAEALIQKILKSDAQFKRFIRNSS